MWSERFVWQVFVNKAVNIFAYATACANAQRCHSEASAVTRWSMSASE
jgi:hypothetical protein